uniref:O-fucosyltransferase family protein n=1 Tax=Tetraselmis sp. GSL018 TaxID=582737 RepID=A0A061R3R6_9CHLO
MVINFTRSGLGGLNNLLWSVTHAIKSGCKNAQHMYHTASDECFPVVLLPRLPVDLLHTAMELPNASFVHFSEIFDVDRLTSVVLQRLRCLVTDDRTFNRFLTSGSIVKDITFVNKEDASIFSQSEVRGSTNDLVYRGLSPSTRINRILERCTSQMRLKFGYSGYVAVHLRLEEDWWQYHCRNNQIEVTNRLCFESEEIVSIVLSTNRLNRFRNFLLVHSALLTRPGDTKQKIDPLPHWPPNKTVISVQNLQCLNDKLKYTEQASLSFFLAGASTEFVGLKGSSFTDGVKRYRTGRCLNCEYPAFYFNVPEVLYSRAVGIS